MCIPSWPESLVSFVDIPLRCANATFCMMCLSDRCLNLLHMPERPALWAMRAYIMGYNAALCILRVVPFRRCMLEPSSASLQERVMPLHRLPRWLA